MFNIDTLLVFMSSMAIGFYLGQVYGAAQQGFRDNRSVDGAYSNGYKAGRKSVEEEKRGNKGE